VLHDISHGDPRVRGTDGEGEGSYGDTLVAEPNYNTYAYDIDESNLAGLDTEDQFSNRLRQAAALTGDVGVEADIFRLDRCYHERRALQARKKDLDADHRVWQHKYSTYLSDRDAVESREKEVRRRLAEAKVRSRVREFLGERGVSRAVPGEGWAHLMLENYDDLRRDLVN